MDVPQPLHSFTPHAGKLWNSLPSSVCSLVSPSRVDVSFACSWELVVGAANIFFFIFFFLDLFPFAVVLNPSRKNKLWDSLPLFVFPYVSPSDVDLSFGHSWELFVEQRIPFFFFTCLICCNTKSLAQVNSESVFLHLYCLLPLFPKLTFPPSTPESCLWEQRITFFYYSFLFFHCRASE